MTEEEGAGIVLDVVAARVLGAAGQDGEVPRGAAGVLGPVGTGVGGPPQPQGGAVAPVRDSKNPTGPVIGFTPTAFAAFVDGIKAAR
ncbi:DUF397 domain-containing protein [Streptomyces sp. AB3(2024)]|uniref:DUF397 domain-containing protein n=1 Tax=Streptomyces sp. AB3(2024) TaxID=3317321 RepID=UPI0035A3C9C3